MDFSDRLLNSMRFRNIKPIELAELTKLTRGIISKYLNRKATPTQKNIALISKALDVSPSYLIGITDEMVLNHNDYSSERIKIINNYLLALTDDQLAIIEYTAKNLKEANEKRNKKDK